MRFSEDIQNLAISVTHFETYFNNGTKEISHSLNQLSKIRALLSTIFFKSPESSNGTVGFRQLLRPSNNLLGVNTPACSSESILLPKPIGKLLMELATCCANVSHCKIEMRSLLMVRLSDSFICWIFLFTFPWTKCAPTGQGLNSTPKSMG